MTEQVENDQVVDAPEPTANEVEARHAGWVPKDEYQGDENKWVDADEFIRRGPLFEKINSTGRELKEVRKALEQLKAHHNQVKEIAFKDAIAALKAEKKQAFIEGDPDKIVAIDERIDDAKEKQRAFEAQQAVEIAQSVQTQINPEFQAWTNRNSWYDTSKPMRAFADALGIELHQSGLSPSEVLKRVEAQVKEEFPNKFRNANRDKALTVESGGKGTGKASSSHYNLTDTERSVMNTFIRQGIMTAEQYVAELKKTKES